MLAFKILLGGRSFDDREDFSKGRVAFSATLRVGWRVEDAMEGFLVIAILPKRMGEDDVDHSEFFFARVDGVNHSGFFFARMLPVSGSETHVLVEHLLVHGRRVS